MLRRILSAIGNNWGKVYFFIAVGAVIFTYGFLVGNNEILPHSILASARATYFELMKRYRNDFPGLNPPSYYTWPFSDNDLEIIDEETSETVREYGLTPKTSASLTANIP